LHPASLEHALAATADEVFIFSSGALARAGKLSRLLDQSGAYSLVLRGRAAEFRAALEARGVALSGGPRRFFVELPAGMKTEDLLLLSTEVGAPIVELLPELPFTEPSLELASSARSSAG
jgi:ABC-2 type transport system ATP-binding protein